MLLVSGATLIDPGLERVFGGVGRLRYPWQEVTAAFEHGWPGVPLLPHLAGNLVLLALAAPAAERALGAWRFLVLTLAALVLQVAVRRTTGIDGNGASLFLWAYPPVLWACERGRPGEQAPPAGALPVAPVLFVTWGVIPLVMTGLLLAQGHGPVVAFLGGNAFHLAATAAGFAAVAAWRGHIRHRAAGPWPPPADRGDRGAAVGALAIPGFLLVLLALAISGNLDAAG